MISYSLRDIESRELLPGLHGRFLHSDSITLAYWQIEAGAEMPLHSHPHEQVVNVLEGEFELTVNEETKRFGPGSVVMLASAVPHGGKALSACRLLDIFHPVREDYR